MNASWYDVLDVEPTASADEIRAAWRAAVADLDPTDRRFRVFNQAAEVLLDPAARASYDAELTAQQERDRAEAVSPEHEDAAPTSTALAVEEGPADSAPTARTGRATVGGRSLPLVPGWALTGLAVLLAAGLVLFGVLLTKPSDSSVEGDTEAAQATAERAIVPLLSYDYRHLDESRTEATAVVTDGYRDDYDKIFAVVQRNAPHTETVVRTQYLASGIIRSGVDRATILVFFNQRTTNKQHPRVPVVYKSQVTVSMAKVGGEWLVDGLTSNGDRS